MKNKLIIIFILTINILNAQNQEFPLSTRDRIEGFYYKDTNNVFTPYTGVWIGQIKGKIFKITFEKVKEFNKFDKYWSDRIYGRYEMVDSKGNILYSTYKRERPKVFSVGTKEMKGKLKLVFIDSCIEGYIYLKFTDSTKTKIEWEYEDIPQTIAVLEGQEPNCAKIYEMPQERFILVKQ